MNDKSEIIKLSAVIECDVYSKHIKYTVDSVLRQTYKNIEIICVDDGFNDKYGEIKEILSKRNRNIVFLKNRQPRGSIYSFNLGIEAARGEYILPLYADDLTEKTYIEKAVKIFEQNDKPGFVYCNSKILSRNKNYTGLQSEYFDIFDILFGYKIRSSSIFKKSDFLNVGKYKYYMEYGFENYDLCLSFVENGLKPYKIDETLFFHDTDVMNYRNNIYENHKREIIRQLIKNHTELFVNNEKFFKKIFNC